MDKRQSLACRLTSSGIRTRGSRSSLAVNTFGSKTMAVWHKHTTCLCQTSQPLLVQRGSSISHNNVIRGRDRDPIPFSPSLMGMCLAFCHNRKPHTFPDNRMCKNHIVCAKQSRNMHRLSHLAQYSTLFLRPITILALPLQPKII